MLSHLRHYLYTTFRRIKPDDTKEDREVLARLNERNDQAASKAQINLTSLLITTLERTGD
jgi:hypothetical protein